MERYPKDIDISIEDFRNSNWLAAITDSSREDCSSMWQSLSSAARQAIKDKKLEKGKVLWLLADACSMMLRPSSLNEPFKPIMVMNGKRSALPEDFQSSDIAFFAQIEGSLRLEGLSIIEHASARSHRTFPFSNFLSLIACLAADESELCRMLRDGAGERLKEIENSLIEAIKGPTNDDDLVLWASDLLSKYKLGHQQKGDIAEKLEQLAIEFNDSGDLHKARDYFNAAAEVFRELKNKEKHAEMIVKVAEKWEKEALNSPSNIVATSSYEKAIQKYRNIPRALRGRYDVDDRIANLHTKLNSAGEKLLEEMGEITSPVIDISELVENARNSVKGKSAIDALDTLANVYQARVDKIRENSKKTLKESLQSLFLAKQ
jgi:hypothetical protein